MEEDMDDMEKEVSQREDKDLYNKARKRVQFKIHLMIYLLANSILWLFYRFVFSPIEAVKEGTFRFVLFVSLAWGIVLIAHYLIVYKWGKSYVDKEFNKLKREYKKYKDAQEKK